MQTEHLTFESKTKQWSPPLPSLDSPRTLVLWSGPSGPEAIEALNAAFPSSIIAGYASAAEVLTVRVMRFEHTELMAASTPCAEASQSFAAGEALGRALIGPALRAVFVLSDTIKVNGGELLNGFASVLGAEIVVTGALPADGERPQRVSLGLRGEVSEGVVVAIGLSGDQLVVTHGGTSALEPWGSLVTFTESEVAVKREAEPEREAGTSEAPQPPPEVSLVNDATPTIEVPAISQPSSEEPAGLFLGDQGQQETAPAHVGMDVAFDGRTHRVTVRHTIDETLTWPLQGLAGEVVIDLLAAGAATSGGIERFVEALGRLEASGVEAVRVEGAPGRLIELMANAPRPPRVTFASGVFDAMCGTCLLTRSATVELGEAARALQAGQAPRGPCSHCGAALELSRYAPAIAGLMGVELPKPPPRPVPMWRRALESRRARAISGVAALLVVVACSALAMKQPSAPEPAPVVEADLAPPPSKPALPPAWTEQRFVFGADEVLIVGAGSGATEPEALGPARLDASLALARQLMETIAGTKAYELATRFGAADDEPEQIVARLERQLGGIVTLERVDTFFTPAEAGVEAKVRYRLPRAQFDAAVELYRGSKQAFGLTVSQLLPTSGAEGALVITGLSPAAAKAGAREGDLLVSAGHRRLPTLAALMNAAREINGPVVLGLQSKGARRDIRVIARAR